MATREPYSSGVIIITRWYSAQSNTGMKPDTGLTELSFTWLFTLVALCFPIDMESWNQKNSPGFLVFFMCLLQRCLARMAALVHSSYMGCICCQTRPVGETYLPYWCLALSTQCFFKECPWSEWKEQIENESHLRFHPINKPSHHPIPRVQSYWPTYGILMMSWALDVESCEFKTAKTRPISHFVDKFLVGSWHSHGILNWTNCAHKRSSFRLEDKGYICNYLWLYLQR